jgi:DNA mismatch repair protein MutL
MGGNAFAFYGYPAEFTPGRLKETVETLINTYNHNEQDLKLDLKDNLARSLARGMAIKGGKVLGQEEMQGLIDNLFACSVPYLSPSGKETIITITADELEKRFSQQK